MSKLQQLQELYERSFDDSQSYRAYFFQNKYTGKNAVTVSRNGKIASALYLLNKRMRVGTSNVPCGYISAAATLPQLRGQGILSETMRKAFDKIVDEGGCIAALYPFKHSYYKRFGFVTYTFAQSVPLDFTRETEAYTVEELKEKHSLEMARIYTEYAAGKSGYLVRGEEECAARLAEFFTDSGRAYLVRDKASRPVAYALVDSDDRTAAEEFCCIDMGAITAFSSPCGVRCALPAAAETAGACEYGMIRAVDIVRLLRYASYRQVTDRIRLKITDAFLPCNNRCIELSLFEGKVKICNAADYDREISVEDLTLAALGELPAGCHFLSGFFEEKINFILDKC